MIVYHGTTKNRARKILQSGRIMTANPYTKRYADTTFGFVYVTQRLSDAMEFSARPEIDEKNYRFVVFKIEIDESELSPDIDEKKWESTLTKNGCIECYRVARDLIIGQDVVALFCKDMPNWRALGEYMQNVQYHDIEIGEDEWKDLTNMFGRKKYANK